MKNLLRRRTNMIYCKNCGSIFDAQDQKWYFDCYNCMRDYLAYKHPRSGIIKTISVKSMLEIIFGILTLVFLTNIDVTNNHKTILQFLPIALLGAYILSYYGYLTLHSPFITGGTKLEKHSMKYYMAIASIILGLLHLLFAAVLILKW
jgi:hypothetical protein